MKQGLSYKKLSEVCDFQNGFAFKSNTYKSSGLPILRITNIQKDKIDDADVVYFNSNDYKENLDRFRVFKGDLLIAMSGATTGKLGINTSERIFYLNQRVGKFLPKESLDNKYLFYFLSTKVEENLKISVGAAQPNLSTEQINNFQIPHPPLKEQKQIVAILDEAFAGIDKAKANIEKNIENAKELFQAKLEIVFKEILINHGEYALNSFCEVKDGTHDSPKYVSENGIPFVTQKNVTVFGLDFSDVKLISKTDHDNFYRRSNVALGDILISMIGANRGMACLVNDKRLFSIKNVGLIKENKDKYNSDYLLFFLKSNLAKKYVSENSSGSAQGFIGLTKLREFPIPFTDLGTQNKIADELVRFEGSTRKCIERYNQKILMLESLKKSILQKAFAGELIVDKVGV